MGEVPQRPNADPKAFFTDDDAKAVHDQAQALVGDEVVEVRALGQLKVSEAEELIKQRLLVRSPGGYRLRDPHEGDEAREALALLRSKPK